MCGSRGRSRSDRRREKEERKRQEKAAKNQQKMYEKQMAQQRQNALLASQRQAEQFRISRADADRRFQVQQKAAADRAAAQRQQMEAQRIAQEKALAAQLKAQQEAEAAAKLEAEKARNRGRSIEAADSGVLQRNKQMKKSKKKARLGTTQLTNPLSVAGVKSLGIGSGVGAKSGGLTIGQNKGYS